MAVSLVAMLRGGVGVRQDGFRRKGYDGDEGGRDLVYRGMLRIERR